MKLSIFASLIALTSFTVQAGQSAKMHTWILICPIGKAANDCTLETADKWYQLPIDQPSDHTAAIKVAIKAVKAKLKSRNSYLKIEQFPAGRSMGTDSWIFFACVDPDTIEQNLREADERAKRSAEENNEPPDYSLRRTAEKGECLK
jgi:hypothetical protein